MKIIKQGVVHKNILVCTCVNCGCVFEADCEEVTVFHQFDGDMKKAFCQCPTCKIFKDHEIIENKGDSHTMEIKIKYHADIQKLDFIGGKSDWIDLRAAEDVEMKAGDFKIISLGVSMKLPDGYEAHIAPRSSTFKRWGVIQVNSVGVVDSTYCSDSDVWGYPVLAVRDTVIHKDDRICQFRLVKKMESVVFDEVEHLDGEARGGFGSTGEQ